jgi:tight adherence protein B
MTLLRDLGNGWDHIFHNLSLWGHWVYGQVGPFEVAALVALTVALLTWFGLVLTGGSERGLKEALQPYQVQPLAAARTGQDELLSSVPLLRRLSAILGTFAERRGFRDVLAERLEQAGLPVGVGEFLTIWLVGSAILLVIGGLLGQFLGLIFALVVAGLVPFALLQFLGDRRKRQFAAQIPDVLKLLASSLRAGFSLLQALDAILYQIKEPMARELRRAFAATRIGTPVEDALDAVAARVRSSDFAWTVTAIRIQREVGGNLAEILETVAATMTERERLRREVRTLTAEGRLSAIIVGALPLVLGALIFVVNKAYISELFTTFGGQLALLGGFLLELAGVWWLYRIVQIEI